jgi:hypothetical protein
VQLILAVKSGGLSIANGLVHNSDSILRIFTWVATIFALAFIRVNGAVALKNLKA